MSNGEEEMERLTMKLKADRTGEARVGQRLVATYAESNGIYTAEIGGSPMSFLGKRPLIDFLVKYYEVGV